MSTKIIYSDSFIEFLKKSDSTIAKFLFKLHNKNYLPLLINANEINYITFRGDGNISYLPKGKEHLTNDDGGWKRENRQHGKPAKIIKKLFSDRALKMFKDSDFEAFANQYKSQFNDDGYKFELLDNKQIKTVYDMKRNEGEGSLNGSCMNNDTNYLDIYENCSQLRILVLTNKNGLLCGRALVWQISENIILIDRFYVSHDFMYDKFLNYASENKFWRKVDFKSFSNKTNFLDSEGNEILNREFKINTNTNYAQFPYIDTFQYGNDGFLSNKNSYIYTYSNTDGTREGDEGEDEHEGEVWSGLEDCYICEDDAIYIDSGQRRYRDEYTFSSNVVFLNDCCYHMEDENICLVNGDYYLTDSDEVCEIDGYYYLTDDCTYCERDSCYYLCDDCVYCEIDGEDVLKSEAVEIDDNYYHIDSDSIFKHDNKYYLVSSGVEL